MADPTFTAAPRTRVRSPGMPWGMQVGVRALCASLSLLVIVASGVAWATFQNFTNDIPTGAKVPTTLASDVDGADQNILLIGNDTRAGATRAEMKALHTGHDTTTVNADTMMVLHVPSSGGKPTIVSFPRDSWVTIPGHGLGKINSAYPDGYNAAKDAHLGETAAESAGIIETIKTIEALTGLSIDHYMQVNLLGFYRISEAIGGVQICLNAAQNKTTDADAYGSGYSGINLPKGVSTIEGAQALAFVRQRHGLPHGDLDRVKRQQYFLKAAFKKITSAGILLNPFKLHTLLGAVGKSLLVDPDLDLLSLAQQFQSVATGKITFATIPNNGPKVIYPDGVETAIVEVNKAALPAFIDQLRGKSDKALAKATPAPAASVTVDVLNGTTVARIAARNADGLKSLGFRINTVDSTSVTKSTTVEYPPGQEAQAKAVLAAVPGAKAVPTPDVARVTVVIGANNVMVKGRGRPGPAPAAPGKTVATAPSPADAANGLGCID